MLYLIWQSHQALCHACSIFKLYVDAIIDIIYFLLKLLLYFIEH